MNCLNRIHPVESFARKESDSDYVGYTARHLYQRIVEHTNSAIGKHFLTAREDTNLLKESQFRILKKDQGKFHFSKFKRIFFPE